MQRVLGTTNASATGSAAPAHAARWLFVAGAADFGGHEIMLLRWLEELHAQAQVTPVVLSRANSKLRSATATFAAPQDLPEQRASSGLVRVLMSSVGDALTFTRVVRAVKPTLCVVSEGCLLAQPIFVFIARVLGVPVVVYIPLVDETRRMGFRSGRIRDALVKAFYANLPNGWITLTAEQAEHFRRWTGAQTPVLTLPNTVAKHIERQPSTARSVQSAAPLRILVLGRLDAPQKALDSLMDFLTAHPELQAKLTLSIVGTGPFETELLGRLAAAPVLAAMLSVRGWADTVEVMQLHDALLICSRFEGVPLVMLEAMSLGLPIVASDLPGTRAFLSADFLFAPGDYTRAVHLLEQLRDQQTYEQVVERNRHVFQLRASGAAFSAAVGTLTQQLSGLCARSKDSLHLPVSAE